MRSECILENAFRTHKTVANILNNLRNLKMLSNWWHPVAPLPSLPFDDPFDSYTAMQKTRNGIFSIFIFDERKTKRQTAKHFLTSGTITIDSVNANTKLTQNNHRKNVKYDATAEPKCDSISLIRSCHATNNVDKFANSRRKCCHFFTQIGPHNQSEHETNYQEERS